MTLVPREWTLNVSNSSRTPNFLQTTIFIIFYNIIFIYCNFHLNLSAFLNWLFSIDFPLFTTLLFIYPLLTKNFISLVTQVNLLLLNLYVLSCSNTFNVSKFNDNKKRYISSFLKLVFSEGVLHNLLNYSYYRFIYACFYVAGTVYGYWNSIYVLSCSTWSYT